MKSPEQLRELSAQGEVERERINAEEADELYQKAHAEMEAVAVGYGHTSARIKSFNHQALQIAGKRLQAEGFQVSLQGNKLDISWEKPKAKSWWG